MSSAARSPSTLQHSFQHSLYNGTIGGHSTREGGSDLSLVILQGRVHHSLVEWSNRLSSHKGGCINPLNTCMGGVHQSLALLQSAVPVEGRQEVLHQHARADVHVVAAAARLDVVAEEVLARRDDLKMLLGIARPITARAMVIGIMEDRALWSDCQRGTRLPSRNRPHSGRFSVTKICCFLCGTCKTWSRSEKPRGL